MKEEYREENTTSSRIEGRHSVLEALRAGSLIERLFVQKGCQDGPVLTILREAKKADVIRRPVPRPRQQPGHDCGWQDCSRRLREKARH